MARRLDRFALGPLLWRSIEQAEARPSLDQSAWDRAVVTTARWIDNNRGGYGPVLVVVGGVLGTTLTVGGPLLLRGLIGAVIGLVAAWTVPTLTAGVVALLVPRTQRNEARDYTRALEAHVRDYVEWAKRREIVEDFHGRTMAHFQNILDGHEKSPPAELEKHWRATTDQLVLILQEHGATPELISTIRAPLKTLETRDDTYGDRDMDRIRNNMSTVAHNLRHDNRREEPPATPNPPGVDQ